MSECGTTLELKRESKKRRYVSYQKWEGDTVYSVYKKTLDADEVPFSKFETYYSSYFDNV